MHDSVVDMNFILALDGVSLIITLLDNAQLYSDFLVTQQFSTISITNDSHEYVQLSQHRQPIFAMQSIPIATTRGTALA